MECPRWFQEVAPTERQQFIFGPAGEGRLSRSWPYRPYARGRLVKPDSPGRDFGLLYLGEPLRRAQLQPGLSWSAVAVFLSQVAVTRRLSGRKK